MTLRIKGQEIVVGINGPAGLEESLSNIQDLDIEFQLAILTEGFLGETADRVDDIYHKMKGRLSLHLDTPDVLRFIRRVKDRAQRRSPATTRFDIVATFNFPNGTRARIQILDVKFSTIPITFGGRDQYGTMKLDFEASRARVLF